MNDQPIVDSGKSATPARSWNRTAVLAAMFCIPFFCPPMTLIGAGTGALALRNLKKNPDTKGAWLAWTALSFGVVTTVLASWMLWISGLRTMVVGPSLALAPLFANDTQGMKKEWSGPATALTQEQLAAFTDQVRDTVNRIAALPARFPVVALPLRLCVHLFGLQSKFFATIILGPAALVAVAGDAFGRSAAALAAPGERLAGPVDAAAVPILVASPAGFTAEAGSTHILTASVGHRSGVTYIHL